MRVLVAPDKFAGTLSAVEAAEAIARGWQRAIPGTDIDLAPLSDGGPGFVEVLHAALGGALLSVAAAGPLSGEALVATHVLRSGETAYVEAAQACGLHLVPRNRRDPTVTTTFGVGEMIAAAVDGGARTIVLGLGGSATNDGGAGLLAALGAAPADQLRRGGVALAELSTVDLGPARERVAGVRIVAATDVDNPLLGRNGASVIFGGQKGATAEQITLLDGALANWADLTDPSCADLAGAGAAGGLGHALFLLGGTREPGIDAVLDAVGISDRVARSDLVITGEGSLDNQSLRGKTVTGVARAAAEKDVPCVVVAGRASIGERELHELGVTAAYSMVERAGSVSNAMSRPAVELAGLAEHVARVWKRP